LEVEQGDKMLSFKECQKSFRVGRVCPNVLFNIQLSSVEQLFQEGIETQLFKEMSPAMLIALSCGPAIQVLRANMAGVTMTGFLGPY